MGHFGIHRDLSEPTRMINKAFYSTHISRPPPQSGNSNVGVSFPIFVIRSTNKDVNSP